MANLDHQGLVLERVLSIRACGTYNFALPVLPQGEILKDVIGVPAQAHIKSGLGDVCSTLLGLCVASCFVGPSTPRTACKTSTLVSHWVPTFMLARRLKLQPVPCWAGSRAWWEQAHCQAALTQDPLADITLRVTVLPSLLIPAFGTPTSVHVYIAGHRMSRAVPF